MAAAIPGLNFGPEVTYILAAILIITGLALAFYGHGLWTTVMSMIGALLGSAVGFLFGAALGGLAARPGLSLLTNTIGTPGPAGLGVFPLGASLQPAAIKKKKPARTRAAAPPPPPPPPPPYA